jgi:hypothetical protein
MAPFDNKGYSELSVKLLNNHISYFGIEINLYRSIISKIDTEFNMYQMQVDQRRHYRPAIKIRGIITFPVSRPRTTGSTGIFFESTQSIKAYFRTTDVVKLGDLISINYNLIKESVNLFDYTQQEIFLEVGQITDYGLKFTSQIEYNLVLARMKDKIDIVDNDPVFGGE